MRGPSQSAEVGDAAEIYPNFGVFMIPACIAKSGATIKFGVAEEPILGILCNNSPIIHPRDHISTALVYPPLDITTCKYVAKQWWNLLQMKRFPTCFEDLNLI